MPKPENMQEPKEALKAEVERLRAENLLLREAQEVGKPHEYKLPGKPLTYWLSKSCYLKQHGQFHARYVEATPKVPVKVTLGPDQLPNSSMTLIKEPEQAAPEPPETAMHSKKAGGPPKAAEVFDKKADGSVREADK